MVTAAIVRSSIFRFAVTGAIGFAIDGGMMTALHSVVGWSPILARFVSFPVALTVTWYINRVWSFARGRDIDAVRQYGTYASIQLVGALLNLAVFSGLIAMEGAFAAWPIVPLGVASIFAMFFNYYAARRFAYRSRP